ncbi:MAG: (Fe-S)-binding protein [Nitrososphaeria archaeon]|nr:(Fe-S)-binding protein [Nitrososphaeria archaeon]MDW7986714.1 (Fe-S)-binding protein [Nitrososphaerota archaeon]
MAPPIKEILRIIVENVIRVGMPIPVSRRVVFKWAEGLGLQKNSETILFTGTLYQLVPYITSIVGRLESIEKSKLSSLLMSFGAKLSGIADRLLVRTPRGEIERQYEVLRRIVALLKKTDTRFGYLYEDDMYSGALLYDMGLDNYFREHAEKVYDRLKDLGVETLITVDPHTTYIMKEVYREVLPRYSLKVKNYLEVLSSSDLTPYRIIRKDVTIHDPCYYARYLKIVEEPRKLLRSGGINIIEANRVRELTFCCGGPIESISPTLSRSVALMRMDELSTSCKNIVVMCPICYANLSRVKAVDTNVDDISNYLYSIYCE